MKIEPIKIVIQFNCPKCRAEDWGRGVEWVTVDRDLLARMAWEFNSEDPVSEYTQAERALIHEWMT